MTGLDMLLGSTISALALAMASASPSPETTTIPNLPGIETSGEEMEIPASDIAALAPIIVATTQQDPPRDAQQEDTDLPASDAPAPLFTDDSFKDDTSFEVEPGLEGFSSAPDRGPKVFTELSDEQVFEKVVTYIEGIDTYTARFIQTAPSGSVSAGIMKMDRPGKLRVEYDAPNPQLIIANQGKLYIHDADLETTDSYPIRRTPLRFLLSKKVKADDLQIIAITRTDSSVGVSLASTDEETEGELMLVFEAPDLLLRRWVVIDPAGEETIFDLDEIIVGEKIANNEFRIPEAGGSFIRDR
jgi:outer membrane lipoprotein-sorting protein